MSYRIEIVGGIGDKSPLDAMEYIFGGIQRISDLYDASLKDMPQFSV